MIDNLLTIKVDYIEGENNTSADANSLVLFLFSNSYNLFDNLFRKFPQIDNWTKFHPSQVLLSVLYSVLFKEQNRGR